MTETVIDIDVVRAVARMAPPPMRTNGHTSNMAILEDSRAAWRSVLTRDVCERTKARYPKCRCAGVRPHVSLHKFLDAKPCKTTCPRREAIIRIYFHHCVQGRHSLNTATLKEDLHDYDRILEEA